MSNEPFGRQPMPVTITITGDDLDVRYWCDVLRRRSEFKGDSTQELGHGVFKIYPRAVND